MTDRWDETWHRLRAWTNGQGPAERLAAIVLHAEGFTDIDPSHPLGGRDAGKDALVRKAGDPWIMAAYFPRGQQRFSEIKSKFLHDHEGVAANDAVGMAFVTNQELRLSKRKDLADAVGAPVDVFHLERLTTILDRPGMASVRAQFLGIGAEQPGPPAPPRTTRQILDAASPPPGAPDHRSVYDGVLLLQVIAVPVPSVTNHPHASDPRAALESASRSAQTYISG